MTGSKIWKTMLGALQLPSQQRQNNITFTCETPDVDWFDKPTPAAKMLPDWYKKLPSYTGGGKQYSDKGVNGTLKRCMPVFDMATTGYYITLPCDVNVTRDPVGLPIFTWTVPFTLVTEHNLEQLPTFPFPEEFGAQALKWANPWIINTPKGWSTIVLPPVYYPDNPFQILPAVIDTDDFELSIQFPFLMRKNFEGIIKAGTPIAQVIPFKRASWIAKFATDELGMRDKKLNKHNRFMENRYKRTVWNKKDYR